MIAGGSPSPLHARMQRYRAWWALLGGEKNDVGHSEACARASAGLSGSRELSSGLACSRPPTASRPDAPAQLKGSDCMAQKTGDPQHWQLQQGTPGRIGLEDCKGPYDVPEALGVKFVGADGRQLAQQPEVRVAVEVLWLDTPWEL